MLAGRGPVETQLLDRFESDHGADWNTLARDLADLLGARAGPSPGAFRECSDGACPA